MRKFSVFLILPIVICLFSGCSIFQRESNVTKKDLKIQASLALPPKNFTINNNNKHILSEKERKKLILVNLKWDWLKEKTPPGQFEIIIKEPKKSWSYAGFRGRQIAAIGIGKVTRKLINKYSDKGLGFMRKKDENGVFQYGNIALAHGGIVIKDISDGEISLVYDYNKDDLPPEHNGGFTIFLGYVNGESEPIWMKKVVAKK